MDDDVLLQLIRQCILNQQYIVTKHAFEKHGLEGFVYGDVKNAILNGRIISRRDREARVTISGTSDRIASRSEFVGNFLHCVVQWDDVSMMVIITAYRPSIHQWRDGWIRLEQTI